MATKKKSAKKKRAGKKSARKASARKKAPAKRKAPARKKAPAKKKAPARKSRAGGKSPARRKAPVKKKAPAGKKTAPAGKKAASRAPAPARKVARRKAPARGQRDAAFFEHFRQKLLAEREQITRRLDELRDELRGLDETPREMEEWAQEEKDRDILIRLEERETEELRRIQAALSLIDTREYGKCQVCGRPIPRARLEELPTAFRCVEHTR